jgi:hypothetical protein
LALSIDPMMPICDDARASVPRRPEDGKAVFQHLERVIRPSPLMVRTMATRSR